MSVKKWPILDIRTGQLSKRRPGKATTWHVFCVWALHKTASTLTPILPYTIGNKAHWISQTNKDTSQACVASLPLLRYFQQSQPWLHFHAYAFLDTTFWSKECVMTGMEGLWAQDLWQRWLAHCSGWGKHFAGLSAWTSCQPLHTTPPAGLSTSIWG